MVSCVHISDTHTQLSSIAQWLPAANILIHSGDATYQGERHEITQFNDTLGTIKDKYEHILFVPGNHDFGFEDFPYGARKLMTNATVLIDEKIELYGYKFYGSPWQPYYYNWAFQFPEDWMDPEHKAAKKKWAEIPDDTEVLITHSPPYGILDEDHHIGCPYLLDRVLKLKDMKYHLFGHAHQGNAGTRPFEIDGKIFINAAICDREEYKPIQRWHTFELPDKE